MIRKLIVYLASVLLLVSIAPPPSFALSPSNLKKARAYIKQLKRAGKKLDALDIGPYDLAKLGIDGMADTDSDGLPDQFEEDYDKCDADSDGDGISDGDEVVKPDEPSDDEPSYFSHEGVLEARDEEHLKVGTAYFKMDASTACYNASLESMDCSELAVNDCVYVKAVESGDVDTAIKVKLLDAAACAG